MGGELVDGSTSQEPSFSAKEIFEKYLPYYMSIGMTYKEFYEQDVCLTKYYREAYEFKQKQKDYELWLQGVYIYNALQSVMQQALGSKNSNRVKYPPKPLSQREEENSPKTIYEKISDWAKRVNAKYGKRR